MYDDILLFVATCKAESIRRAAEILGIGAPTISRRIHNLEEQLQVSLLINGKNKLELTKRGQNLLEEFSDTQHFFQHKLENALGYSKENKQKLSVALPNILATKVVLPNLHKFLAQFPNVIFEFGQNQDIQNIDNTKYDIIISGIRPNNSNCLFKRLVTVDYELYTTEQFLINHGAINNLTELLALQHRLVLHKGLSEANSTFSIIDEQAQELHLINPQIIITSYTEATTLLHTNNYVSSLCTSISRPVDNFVKILPGFKRQQDIFCIRKNVRQSEIEQAFLEFLLQEYVAIT